MQNVSKKENAEKASLSAAKMSRMSLPVMNSASLQRSATGSHFSQVPATVSFMRTVLNSAPMTALTVSQVCLSLMDVTRARSQMNCVALSS